MNPGLTIILTDRSQRPAAEWEPLSEHPLVGKDVLELLSSSMYVNPLAIYREYIQNSADAIDEARRAGELGPRASGRVDVTIDAAARTVRIRDNGTGLGRSTFVSRLVAFGGSVKRGSYARGFRGVGRLAGLGYSQELIFRSRASAEEPVSELRWNCRELKALLRGQQGTQSLEEIVKETVSTRRLKDSSLPKRFFEVELIGIVRHGNDVLMNRGAVQGYLSQVAPVPFAPSFKFGPDIEGFLSSKVNLGNIEIYIDGSEQPVYRPHRDQFEMRKGVTNSFCDMETLMIPGSDGKVAAVGWILHHAYLGAIPASSHIQGLRLRSGNMQIGEANVLEDVFPEPRFNSWTVGEIHVLDPHVLPNGRRDHFEHSVHFRTILNFLSTTGRDLARRCRVSSFRRNRMRHFEQIIRAANEDLAVLRQAAMTRSKRMKLKGDIGERIQTLEKIADSSVLGSDIQDSFKKRLASLKVRARKLSAANLSHRKLARLREPKRRLIQRLCDLIYENSDKQGAARLLIERILRGL